MGDTPPPVGRSTASQSPREANAAMTKKLLSAAPVQIPEEGYGLRVLATTGRHTGRSHLTPVGVLRHHGRSYVVCPDRTRDWPRNLRTQPECVIRIGSHRWRCHAAAVTGEPGVEVVAAYLSVVQAPWALRSFGLGEAPDPEEITASFGRFDVFRLDDADRGGGAA